MLKKEHSEALKGQFIKDIQAKLYSVLISTEHFRQSSKLLNAARVEKLPVDCFFIFISLQIFRRADKNGECDLLLCHI